MQFLAQVEEFEEWDTKLDSYPREDWGHAKGEK